MVGRRTILSFPISNTNLDLLDNIYELVDTLTFHMRSITAEMWRVFELTYALFKSDGLDFLEEMVPSLDNFVSYGSEVIASRPDYVQSLVDIYRTSVVDDHLGENDAVNGSKLAESLLLNLRGRVDDVRCLRSHSLTETYSMIVSANHCGNCSYRPSPTCKGRWQVPALVQSGSPHQCRLIQPERGFAFHRHVASSVLRIVVWIHQWTEESAR